MLYNVSSLIRFRYEPIQIVCRLHESNVPYAVSVVSGELEYSNNMIAVYDSSQNTEKAHGFGLCVQTPLFGKQSVNRLLETIEINRMFGVSKIVMYNVSVIENVYPLLEMYISQGVVELISWDVPTIAIEKGLHYFGQQVSMNDCLYRMMARVRYVAFTDLDEILVPRAASNLEQLLKQLPNSTQGRKTAVFYFSNAYFPLSNDSNSPQSQHDLTIPYNIQRCPAIDDNIGVFTKYIVEAKYVQYIGVHIVFKTINNAGSFYVPSKLGLMHHYRNIADTKNCTIEDTYMLRFKSTLKKRVLASMQKYIYDA